MLDYRALLQTNFIHRTGRVNVFDLVVKELLYEMTVTQPGGRSTTLGKLWEAVDKTHPPYHYRRHLRRAQTARDAFNTAFGGILPDLQQKTADILSHLLAPTTAINLDFPGVGYNKDLRNYTGGQFFLEVTLNGDPLTEHQNFLNEARLSAIAISIYLASLLVSIPAPVPGAPPFPKILVLDDVLIGLDMANRLPVIKLLHKFFGDWQLLLFTYDRAWYEIARQQLDGWRHYELFTAQVGDHERPLLKEDTDHLSRALDFLLAGEVKAAAVHVRTKFEEVLKAGCTRLGAKVSYASNPKTLTANDIWSALQAHPVATLPAPTTFTKNGVTYMIRPRPHADHVVDNDLRRRVIHALSWVLNPLSHSETVERYRAEIEAAIFAIADLERAIQHVAVEQEVALQFERGTLLDLIRNYHPPPPPVA